MHLIVAQREAALAAGLDVEMLLAAMPVGMSIFSLVMFLDIWRFGHMIRKKGQLQDVAFSCVGQAILVIICALIIAGWLLLVAKMLPVVRELPDAFRTLLLIAVPFLALGSFAIAESKRGSSAA